MATLRAQRDDALLEWKYQSAELARSHDQAAAQLAKMAGSGDIESPDLQAAYAAARKGVQEASAKEALAREKYYELRGQIEARAQSVAKTEGSAELRPKTAAGALAEWKLRESGGYDAAAVADARERYYYLRSVEDNRRQDPTLAWSAAQLIGRPDAQPGREDRLAWSSATPDGQSEWIEVSYEKPVEAVAVMISESFNPGAIGSVQVFDGTGKWQWVLEGRTARPVDKDHQITMLPLSTERPVTKVRITIESVPVPGYNQIDAVGLLDKKGQMHWATSATASSERLQTKSASDATFDGSIFKALEFMRHGAHEHVDVKSQNCQNCHQVQTGSDAYPSLQTMFRGLARMQTPYPSVTSKDAATSAESAPENQELERRERLTPLRKEIEEINQEINKIKEELDLQSQRDRSRIELEQLRTKLEENRKARAKAQTNTR
jgi:hypothetical protein